MIGAGVLLLCQAAAPSAAEGLQAYIHDMDQMRAVLSLPQQSTSWWAFALLALALLACVAAMVTAWSKRPARKPLKAEASAVPGTLAILPP